MLSPLRKETIFPPHTEIAFAKCISGEKTLRNIREAFGEEIGNTLTQEDLDITKIHEISLTSKHTKCGYAIHLMPKDKRIIGKNNFYKYIQEYPQDREFQKSNLDVFRCSQNTPTILTQDQFRTLYNIFQERFDISTLISHIENANLSQEFIDTIFRDFKNNIYVVNSIAEKTSNQDHINHISNLKKEDFEESPQQDCVKFCLVHLAENINLTLEMFQTLSKGSNRVKTGLIRNPAIPTSVLESMLNDNDDVNSFGRHHVPRQTIGEYARFTLESRKV
jgi:hypothetical protein